jgi:hypothetical protein
MEELIDLVPWNRLRGGDMKYESRCPNCLKKDGLKKTNFSEKLRNPHRSIKCV